MADLPRRRFGHEQVAAFECAAEDGAWMALRGRRYSSPGPRRRADSNALEESGKEDGRTRRLDKSRRGRLAAFWLAKRPPADSANDRRPSRLISCVEQPVKGALCDVSGPNLRTSCLQSGRGWRDN